MNLPRGAAEAAALPQPPAAASSRRRHHPCPASPRRDAKEGAQSTTPTSRKPPPTSRYRSWPSSLFRKGDAAPPPSAHHSDHRSTSTEGTDAAILQMQPGCICKQVHQGIAPYSTEETQQLKQLNLKGNLDLLYREAWQPLPSSLTTAEPSEEGARGAGRQEQRWTLKITVAKREKERRTPLVVSL